MRRLRFLWAFIMGLILTITLLISLSSARVVANSNERFVSTTGRDSIPVDSIFILNNCSSQSDPCRTVQHAVNRANANDRYPRRFTRIIPPIIIKPPTIRFQSNFSPRNNTPKITPMRGNTYVTSTVRVGPTE